MFVSSIKLVIGTKCLNLGRNLYMLLYLLQVCGHQGQTVDERQLSGGSSLQTFDGNVFSRLEPKDIVFKSHHQLRSQSSVQRVWIKEWQLNVLADPFRGNSENCFLRTQEQRAEVGNLFKMEHFTTKKNVLTNVSNKIGKYKCSIYSTLQWRILLGHRCQWCSSR